MTLRIPASSAYVVLVRASVAAMCARLDFTIDRIEDVKLAVAEAAALLLSDVPPGEALDVRFTPDAPDGLRVEMSAPTVHGRSLERDSFTWTVLRPWSTRWWRRSRLSAGSRSRWPCTAPRRNGHERP